MQSCIRYKSSTFLLTEDVSYVVKSFRSTYARYPSSYRSQMSAKRYVCDHPVIYLHGDLLSRPDNPARDYTTRV